MHTRKAMLRRFLIVVSLLPALAAPLQGDRREAAVDAWPGWRGLTAQGRAHQPLPTKWNIDEGIRWKTPIPGRGHSSPIVFGDRVYVTTAYTATTGLLLQGIFRILTLGLVLAIATLALRFVVRRCHPSRSPTWADLTIGSGMIATVLILAVVGYGGDGLFDFARCNIRGWIASAVFASLCLGLTAAVTDSARARLTIALGAVVFATFVLAAFPSKGFAFRGGLASLRMQISIASSAVPLLIGIAVVAAGPARRWSKGARRMVMSGAAIAVVVSGAMLVRHLLLFRDDSFPATTYVPYVSPWFLLVGAVSIASAWLGRGVRAKSLGVNLAVVLSGAVSGVLTAVIAIECLATRSPYLAYQIGAPKWEPLAAGVIVWSTATALLLNTAWVAFGARRGSKESYGLPALFAIMAVALGTVFFVRVNYIHAQSRMVRAIVSLDRQSGDMNWTLAGLEGPQPPIDGRNSPATPTPVTDGRRVCGYFGSPGLMCADSNGRSLWARSDLGHESVMVSGSRLC